MHAPRVSRVAPLVVVAVVSLAGSLGAFIALSSSHRGDERLPAPHTASLLATPAKEQPLAPCWADEAMQRLFDEAPIASWTAPRLKPVPQLLQCRQLPTPSTGRQQCCCLLAKLRPAANASADVELRCLPSLVVPGVAKSGTTALWEALHAHAPHLFGAVDPPPGGSDARNATAVAAGPRWNGHGVGAALRHKEPGSLLAAVRQRDGALGAGPGRGGSSGSGSGGGVSLRRFLAAVPARASTAVPLAQASPLLSCKAGAGFSLACTKAFALALQPLAGNATAPGQLWRWAVGVASARVDIDASALYSSDPAALRAVVALLPADTTTTVVVVRDAVQRIRSEMGQLLRRAGQYVDSRVAVAEEVIDEAGVQMARTLGAEVDAVQACLQERKARVTMPQLLLQTRDVAAHRLEGLGTGVVPDACAWHTRLSAALPGLPVAEQCMVAALKPQMGVSMIARSCYVCAIGALCRAADGFGGRRPTIATVSQDALRADTQSAVEGVLQLMGSGGRLKPPDSPVAGGAAVHHTMGDGWDAQRSPFEEEVQAAIDDALLYPWAITAFGRLIDKGAPP